MNILNHLSREINFNKIYDYKNIMLINLFL